MYYHYLQDTNYNESIIGKYFYVVNITISITYLQFDYDSFTCSGDLNEPKYIVIVTNTTCHVNYRILNTMSKKTEVWRGRFPGDAFVIGECVCAGNDIDKTEKQEFVNVKFSYVEPHLTNVTIIYPSKFTMYF
jgi:hypothetical protein